MRHYETGRFRRRPKGCEVTLHVISYKLETLRNPSIKTKTKDVTMGKIIHNLLGTHSYWQMRPPIPWKTARHPTNWSRRTYAYLKEKRLTLDPMLMKVINVYFLLSKIVCICIVIDVLASCFWVGD